MKEPTAVHYQTPDFSLKFDNPIYLAAQKQALREEALYRIRTGDFTSLYSLVKHIDLSEKELESIFKCWRMSGDMQLMLLYATPLKEKDLGRIKEVDRLLESLREKDEERLR